MCIYPLIYVSLILNRHFCEFPPLFSFLLNLTTHTTRGCRPPWLAIARKRNFMPTLSVYCAESSNDRWVILELLQRQNCASSLVQRSFNQSPQLTRGGTIFRAISEAIAVYLSSSWVSAQNMTREMQAGLQESGEFEHFNRRIVATASYRIQHFPSALRRKCFNKWPLQDCSIVSSCISAY